jgi:hypothetical protein
LLLSLGGASAYAIWVTLRYPGGRLLNQYIYVVPIVVPFVSFLIDRAEKMCPTNFSLSFITARWCFAALIDAIVVGTSMMRVIGNVPYISGHTFFLSYAVLTTKSLVAKTLAALVLLETVYLKYFVWHDLVTSTVGIMCGSLAAVVALRLEARQRMQPILEAGD